MSLNTGWGIRDDVLHDIDQLFDSESSVYRELRTNNKTWKTCIIAKKGVKVKTARQIVREFLKLLREIKAGKYPAGVDRDYGENLLAKYEEDIATLDATPYLVEISQASAPKAVTARRA